MTCSSIEIESSDVMVTVPNGDQQETGVDNPAFQRSLSTYETDKPSFIANGRPSLSNHDPPITEAKFRSDFLLPKKSTSLRDVFSDQFNKCCSCSKDRCNRVLDTILPCYKVLRKYKLKEYLPNDIICGATVGIMQLPQGMAYAILAELPPVVGLYVSFFPVLIYFLFGTSRHVSTGTVAVVSLLTGSVIAKIADGYKSNTVLDKSSNISINDSDIVGSAGNTADDLTLPDDIKIGIAMSLAFLVGCIQLALGLLRLGFVTTYISDALVGGFTTGTAIYVATSQVKTLLGIKIPRTDGLFQIINTYIYIFQRIAQTNIPTLVISIICMALLYIVKEQVNQRFKKKLKVPIPIELFVVVIGTVTSYVWNFNKRFRVQIVGDIPVGIPAPSYPSLNKVDLYITDMIIIAIISFAQSVSMAALFAKKHNYTLDSNQELIAYGAGNIFGSFFSCFPYAASVSRSSVQESAGGRTQVASIFSSGMVLIVILWIGYLFKCLPTCVLSSIIVVAVKNLILQFLELPQIWRTSKYDFFIWVVTCACIVILHVDYGLIIGLGFSIFTVVIRTQRAVVSPMSVISQTKVYRDPNKYSKANLKPGIKIVGFNSPLYFANGDMFVTKLQRITGVKPEKIRKQLRRMAIKNLVSIAVNIPAEENTSGIAAEPTIDDPISTVMNENVTKPTPTRADICPVHHIVVDFSSVPFIDSVGVKVLKQNPDRSGTHYDCHGNHITYLDNVFLVHWNPQSVNPTILGLFLYNPLESDEDIQILKSFGICSTGIRRSKVVCVINMWVFEEYATIDIKVFLACIADDVWSILDTTKFLDKYSDNIFTTMDDAVAVALLDEDNNNLDDAVTYI